MKMNWRPIKTAPKDGTRILVYDENRLAFYSNGFDGIERDDTIIMVEWRPYYTIASRKRDYCWCVPYSDGDEQGGSETVDSPTHWMPLPNKPKQ